METEIEMHGMRRSIRDVDKKLEKVIELTQNFMARPTVSHVQNSPCSICFSDDNANEECQATGSSSLEL